MKKVLLWGDAPNTTTGFAKVNREILSRIYALGGYEITVVGVNYYEEQYDHEKLPFHIIMAREGNDGLGRTKFVRILQQGKWDLVITTLDIGQIETVTKAIIEAREKQHFNWIVYTPVDNDGILPDGIECLRHCDTPFVYSEFGKRVITELDKKVGDRVVVGRLGTKLEDYRELTKSEKRKYRKKYFNIENDDTFLLINVNANRWRKNMAGSLAGFKLFNDKIKNSKYYIHAPIFQQDGGNLALMAKTTGCRVGSILLKADMNPLHGTPDEDMFKIFGCADVIVSSSMAEGWGLSCTEAFACKVPALFPRHTSLQEMIGENEERGYLIDCLDQRFMMPEHSPYWQHVINHKSFADKLERIWNNRNEAKAKTELARKWVEQYTWDSLFEIMRKYL